jgi:RHS repeat-associated protein
MTSRGGASVTWYPYNYPLTINQAGGNFSTFYYAPDRSRYRQTSLNGTVTEDRIYVAGIFEKLNSSAVGIEYRHYIVANGEKVAIKVLSASRNDTLYLHSDHLGSTDVITDQTGSIKVHESYDAWGRRRGSNWTGSPSSTDLGTINNTTHIGYTAQEHLDNLGLVDLNGRVYDPTIARFVSADPFVVAPYESQSLNRYSYTWNNPLNHTDPTGFCPDDNDANCTANNGSITNDRTYAAAQQEITQPATSRPINKGGAEASVQTGQTTDSTLSDEHATADRGSASMNPGSAASNSSEGGPSNQAAQQVVAELLVTADRNRFVDYSPTTMNPWGGSAMRMPTSTYQQCAMGMCHGNAYAPWTRVSPDDNTDKALTLITMLVTLPVEELEGFNLLEEGFDVGMGAEGELAGSIRNVNPSGSMTNCVNCAIATDATLAGRPASALPSRVTSITVLERMFGGKFEHVSGRAAIEAQLLRAGPGARGIVLGSHAAPVPGHVWNAVNQRGIVRFLDGQTGKPASFEGYSGLQFLRTN